MTSVMERTRSEADAVPERSRPKIRGRGWPVAVVGIVAVLVCAAAGWLWAQAADTGPERQVLVAAVPMPAGHVIVSSDLSEAAVDAEGLELIGTDQAGSVIGQTLALPVAAGTVLTPDLLGPALSPAPGRAETTLALPDGFYPAGIEPGQSVVLVAAPNEAVAAVDVWQMAAVVRSVMTADGGVLVGLEFDAGHRTGLASARSGGLFLVSMVADVPIQEAGE